MNTLTILLAALPAVSAHIGLWHPAGLDFNGDGYSLVEPLAEMSFSQWWFHGNLDKADKAYAADPMDLPAGGTATVELACRKEHTSWGDKTSDEPCPGTDEISVNSLHAGDGRLDVSEIAGCGLAIAYKSDFASVQPEDFTVFSVNTDCVHTRETSFEIPADMPACDGGKCICAWFWQGKNSQNEMYMTGFVCNISGSSSTKAIGTPKAPVYCNGNEQSCVAGPKQPMYWANSEGGNVANAENMAYQEKPSYNEAWGFKNGAQNDIFSGSGSGSNSGSGSSASAAPSSTSGGSSDSPSSSAPEPTSDAAPSSEDSAPVSTPAPTGTAAPSDEDTMSILPISSSEPSNPSAIPTTLVTRTRKDGGWGSRPTQAPESPEAARGSVSEGNCSWAGHCEGDSCSSNEECDGKLACNEGTCGAATYDRRMRMRMARK